jgi:hypothetical protein
VTGGESTGFQAAPGHCAGEDRNCTTQISVPWASRLRPAIAPGEDRNHRTGDGAATVERIGWHAEHGLLELRGRADRVQRVQETGGQPGLGEVLIEVRRTARTRGPPGAAARPAAPRRTSALRPSTRAATAAARTTDRCTAPTTARPASRPRSVRRRVRNPARHAAGCAKAAGLLQPTRSEPQGGETPPIALQPRSATPKTRRANLRLCRSSVQ